VEAFIDLDLTDPKRFPFLENTALWERIAGDTYEHEAEHSDQVTALVDYIKSGQQQSESDG
jgi:hypothetical protein